MLKDKYIPKNIIDKNIKSIQKMNDKDSELIENFEKLN